jgi:hypothetical protein
MLVEKRVLNKDAMLKCISILNQFFNSRLSVPNLSPLTLASAVNGMSHDAFTRRINMQTAVGHPHRGIKLDFVDRYYDDQEITDEPNDKIIKGVNAAISHYLGGRRAEFVFKAHLKDEPRLSTKVSECKTRLFFASPFDCIILQRMFLSPFYTLLIEQGLKVGIAVGIKMQSDAQAVYDALYPWHENIIEGDYSGYDQAMPVGIGVIANRIVSDFLEGHGYGAEAMAITNGLLNDNLHPHINILEDHFMASGLQPSGKYGTAEDNSLRGLAILTYVWVMSDCVNDLLVWDHVKPLVYGDDLLFGVSDVAKERGFTAKFYGERVQSLLGIGFTTASKGEVTEDYISFRDCSFLKRTFRNSPLFDRLVAPLGVNTFHKMLHWQMVSKKATAADVHVGIANSFLTEIALSVLSVQALVDCYVYILTKLHKHKGEFGTPIGNQVLKPSTILKNLGALDQAISEAIYIEEKAVEGDLKRNSINPSEIFHESVSELNGILQESFALNGHSLEVELGTISKELQNLANPFPGQPWHRVVKTTSYLSDWRVRKRAKEYYALLARRDSILDTLRMQGASESADYKQESDDTKFVDDDLNGEEISLVKPSRVLSFPEERDTTVVSFLSRPVHMASISVSVNSPANSVIDLWDTYLLQPAVRAKLRNISMIRATICAKVVITAMPYHYGWVMASWQPFGQRNDILDAASVDNMTFVNYLSQAMVCSNTTVGSNVPMVLKCPWICEKPMRRLYNDAATSISATTPFDDFVDIGELYLESAGPIEAATPLPTEVSITVYAWLEDVALGPPTGTITVVQESSDEREIGPVERITSNAANIMEHLQAVPMIAPYAKASAMALRGMESLSALFGFSVPTVLNEPVRVKNNAFQNGSQAIGMDTGVRLTLDPKQELTVDPTVIGTSEDELSIRSLCGKPTVVRRINWGVDAPPMIVVHSEFVYPRSQTVSAGYVQPTPMSMLQRFFKKWRGSITYQFDVVCSKFHRGKLMFIWEPNVHQNNIINASIDMNKQHCRVIDIQEDTQFTITVDWGMSVNWLNMDEHNGVLKMIPLTELQSPDGSSVHLIMKMWSNDMSFALPEQEALSAYVDNIISTTQESDDAKHEIDFVINPNASGVKHLTELTYGEIPLSCRSLMKRFVTTYTKSITDNADSKIMTYLYTPLYPNIQDGLALRTGCTASVYDVLDRAFLAKRGGARYRVIYQKNNFVQSPLHYTTVELAPENNSTYNYGAGWTDDITKRSLWGAAPVSTFVDGGIEYEIPMYTSEFFRYCTTINSPPNYDVNFVKAASVRTSVASGTRYDVQVDRSIAEDFTFLCFLGAPGYAT